MKDITLENGTKGRFEVGSNMVFEGWKLYYEINGVRSEEISQGERTSINVKQGDKVVVRYKKDGDIEGLKDVFIGPIDITELKIAYTLIYNTNGGTTIEREVQYKAQEENIPTFTVTATPTTKEGYTFKEWNTKENGIGGITYGIGQEIDFEGEVTYTLYAQWIENPVVTAKNIATNNMVRKTDLKFEDLFDIDWGSDGNGTATYSITGNLNFQNTPLSNAESIENVKELEVGTYEVTCTATSSPSGIIATDTKEIKVMQLCSTTVQNEADISVAAKAIYSEYDLAYFRDLVNDKTNSQANINGKIMKAINMENVCSAAIGSWKPIGYNEDNSWSHYIEYTGIFDGGSNKLTNMYSNGKLIDEEKIYGGGLFGVSSGWIKNVEISGNYKAHRGAGGIICWNKGTVSNCLNEVKVEAIKAGNYAGTAGIVLWNYGTVRQCKNKGEIKVNKTDIETNDDSVVGGIVGNNSTGGAEYNIEGAIGLVEECCNISTTTIEGKVAVGGICGINNGGEVNNCYNTSNVSGTTWVGGVVGYSKGGINNVYNTGNITGTKYVGGITGKLEGNGNTSNWYNAGTVTGTENFNPSAGEMSSYGGLWSGNSKYDLTIDDIKGWTLNELQSSYLNNKYKLDTNNINNGLPILVWEN